MKGFLATVTILTLTFTVFAFVPATYAADPPASPAQGSAPAVDDDSPLGRLQRVGEAADLVAPQQELQLAAIIGRIIAAASSLLGVIFVAQMVYAGWLWMTARDEADQLDKAKHIIRRSIVGLAIVLGAWAITTFVIVKFITATT